MGGKRNTMTEFYERMNVQNKEKAEIVNYVMDMFNDKNTLVLDLGAGSFVIEKMLRENKFKGSMIAIEKNAVECKPMTRCEIVQDDIFYGTLSRIKKICKFKHVVIILSAVLHELSKQKLEKIADLIRLIGHTTHIHLAIREPIITDDLFTEDFEILVDEKYLEYKDLHRREWTERVTFLNYCFLLSYGEEAWKRESREGRFTFTLMEIMDFISKCGCEIDSFDEEHNPFYQHTLPYDMYDKIRYTGTLIICYQKKG